MPYVTIEDRVDRLDALFGQFMAESAVLNKKAEERMSRFEQEMREFKDEMRQDRKAMNKQWGDLANKMGTIVEDILAPNLKRLATEYFGFPQIEEMLIRWNRRKPNAPSQWQEFDVVIAGSESVIVGEAKSSMNLASAERFAEKLEEFPAFAPHLSHLKVIPVVGCWSIPPQVVERLSELGIYAMGMGEDTMEIVNGDAVRQRNA